MISSLLIALALVAEPLPSTASVYQLFPVSGVFFPTQDGASRIDPEFRASLGAPEMGYFAQAFRARFPQAAQSITEGNQRRTYAVSLQVARASKYLVPKIDGTVDLYLPVTASVYFSNVMTGEVLFSDTRTTITTAKVTPDQGRDGSPTVRKAFTDTFRGVVDDLIADAASKFRPTVVSARAVEEWKGLAILDGGRQQGVSRGDTLADEKGNELRVISAGPTYAIANVELGVLTIGSTFAKATNRTLAEIRKPRVLPIVETAPAGFPEEALVQLFSDALGSEAPVSLVPVNRTFGAVVKAVGSQIDLTKEKLTQRELPNFFVRLHVLEPIVFERSTNLAYKSIRVTNALTYAEFVDRSGRVLFAAHGRNRIEDEITQGMALDVEARKEVAVKNALLALATRLATVMKFETAQLSVTQTEPALQALDPHGLLAAGSTLRAYRSIGKVSGIQGDVRVPTWDVRVSGVSGESARIETVLPVVAGAPAVAKDDVLILDGVATPTARRMRFGGCGSPAEKLGSLSLPEYGELALNLFAERYPAPFFVTGLAQKVNELVRGGTGFKEDVALAEPAVEYCVQPVYRIDLDKPTCEDATCAEVARVKLTYRIRKGSATAEVIARSGMEARMVAGALPQAVTAAVRQEALHADLIDEVLKVAGAAAAAAADEKL